MNMMVRETQWRLQDGGARWIALIIWSEADTSLLNSFKSVAATCSLNLASEINPRS